MKYLANFAEEIGGKQYQPGDEIDVKGLGDEADGTIDYLVREGRVTTLADDDPDVIATGGDNTSETDGRAPLGSMSKAELLATARKEGVTAGDDMTKAEIVDAIEAKRAGE